MQKCQLLLKKKMRNNGKSVKQNYELSIGDLIEKMFHMQETYLTNTYELIRFLKVRDYSNLQTRGLREIL